MEAPANPPATDNPPGMVTGTTEEGNRTVAVALPGSSGTTPVLVAVVVMLILFIIGGAVYLRTKNRSGPEKEKESVEPEKKKED
jgi:hypothetical protein